MNPIQVASAASSEGAILPDGRIEGLVLGAAERFVVRDYEPPEKWWVSPVSVPITVESSMSLDPDAVLRMIFEDGDWASTISFEPGIDVVLGGTLELTFDDDVRPDALIGATFDLFDWDGAVRTGEFDRIVTEWDAVWDTSGLYSTGEVTLVWAVPEPATWGLLLIGGAGMTWILHRRGRDGTY